MIGKTLGHYEITDKLGQGGMGSVWLAQDVKLGRQVAIKTLPEEFAKDEERLARFEREAKLLASLNHPNIATIHGLEEHDGTRFLVLELVEGDTLADRLKRGAIPVEESLRLALQIAEALEAAHEKGVIHRDLKPGNIKVTPDGKVKVLDFGLAKAFIGDGADASLSNSPTLSMAATQKGVILGTAAYMSPEQARGQEVDKRADIWAFGCVLFEMVTGRQVYEGPTASDVLAGVLAREPDWKSLPPNVHPRIRLLLDRCLEKESRDRYGDISDARVDIQKVMADPGFRHGTADGTGVPAGVGRWKRLAVAFAAVAAVLTGTLAWSLLRPSAPEARPVSRYSIELPVTQRANGRGSSVAVSPDGTQMVYVGPGEQSGIQLWLRRRDQLQATPIAGTEGAENPVLSPDGQRVAFHEGGGVRVVSLSGGPPLAIVESGVGVGGLAWGPDGYIYFRAQGSSALVRVPETSGEVEPFTVLDPAQSETGHIWPQALPNGRGVLLTVAHEPSGDVSQHDIAVADMETGEHEILVRGVFARYAASGHLVYVTADGTLLAAPFDHDGLQLAGDPVALTEGVGVRSLGSVHLALSDDGTLVYQAGGGALQSEFVWVTRSGQATSVDRGWTFVSPTNFGSRLSPDGTRMAFNAEVEGNRDIWIKHLPDGPRERLTFSEDDDIRPFWTPDGQTVTYFSGPLNEGTVWSKRADGTGEAVLVLDEERGFAQGSWSPDGEWLVLRAAATVAVGLGLRDILAFRPGEDSAAIPLVATPEFAEGAPALSPDGRWLAYSSNETGSYEVFVRPLPDVNSARVRVSRDGGLGPLWAHSGRELFFVDEDRGLVAAQFDPGSGQVLAQETLFTIPAGYQVSPGDNFYDITSDDQRFLMVRPYEGEGEAAATEVIVVENFFEELKERVPVP